MMDLSLYRTEIQENIKYIEEYQLVEPEKVLEACDKIEEYGKKKNDNALIGYAEYAKGTTFYLHNKSKLAMSCMSRCIEPFTKINEWGYIGIAYNIMGIISLNRGNAPEAMDYYLKGISLLETHSMPVVESMLHMNIATLYLNINDPNKAIYHLESCYNFARYNSEDKDSVLTLSSVYTALGRAYLLLAGDDVNDKSAITKEYVNKAEEYALSLKKECLDYVKDNYLMGILLFEARLYNRKGDIDLRDWRIAEIDNLFQSGKITILDLFDDIYEYLEMLINIEKYSEFFRIYEVMEDIIRKVDVKNLERKVLTLKIRYYKKVGKTEDYQMASVLYFELSEMLEKENRLTISQMIEIRNSNNILIEQNDKVHRENVELHRRSETDPLTGIYNRFMLNEYSEKAFKRAVDNNTDFAIEILDIDYFKQFNDNYGHQNGDECIKFIAQMLTKLSNTIEGEKQNIFVSRYGGDEFVVIYEGLSEAETSTKAEELKASILDRAMEHKYSLAADVVTISQGICWGKPHIGQTVWEYLHTADTMLYEVKEVSRNSIKLGRYE